jgi:hypothetical protein
MSEYKEIALQSTCSLIISLEYLYVGTGKTDYPNHKEKLKHCQLNEN